MIRFKASPMAAMVLQLDRKSAGCDVKSLGNDWYEALPEDAAQILADAELRVSDSGSFGDEAWRYVRPCRAVAVRIRKQLAWYGEAVKKNGQ